jgi:hypothetical protein
MTMTFHFNIKLDRWTITIGGVIGFLLVVGIFPLPFFLAGLLDRERAQQELRHYLKWRAGNQLMSEMRAAGLRSPNAEQAQHWKERAASINLNSYRRKSGVSSLSHPAHQAGCSWLRSSVAMQTNRNRHAIFP